MSKYDRVFKTRQCVYRQDGMSVYLPTRAVYIDMFTKLSSCMFVHCSFFGLTCNKCPYSV